MKATSPGGVFFRQERIGLGGEKFHMLKFRSMFIDAEERLADLQRERPRQRQRRHVQDEERPAGHEVGRVLRRFSLDELPQLFNVFRGDMSLVGPRPPLDREVQQYADSVHRRFLVKPGITGLWQVSGRSDLDWEETVRLDLFYVENWTMTGDLVILLKTVRAVLKSEGLLTVSCLVAEDSAFSGAAVVRDPGAAVRPARGGPITAGRWMTDDERVMER